ncbi:MAG: hypothetical protein R3E39_07895 [Anaerolineae bacterium]
MSTDILQTIQHLQFQNKEQAEVLLLTFLRDIYEPSIRSVELRPSALSLNSFNGYLQLGNGTRQFFKSHSESDTIINEYYNTGLLIDAGYPIIQPVFGSTEVGKQLLVYNIVDSPSVFDVSWQIENGNEVLANRLQSVQEQSDKELLTIYLNTVQPQSAGDAAKSPIHQLFYHRLTGGRLQRFYGHNRVNTGWLTKIEGTTRSIDDIWNKQWEINGQKYDDSLNSVIQRAIKILSPVQSDISVIGHGDAHNGNVFLNYGHNNDSMTYFDPAFAGRHSPLLDLAKPLFHNVFAMWMYFPDIMRNVFK